MPSARPVALPGGVVVSAERHRGRIVVRFEEPEEGCKSAAQRLVELRAS